MALKVWLPLTGTFENKGISNYTITSSGSSVVSSGKIGSCMKITSSTSLGYTPDFNTNQLSFGGWFKFNLNEIKTKVDTLTYSSSATSPTGNLLGNTSYGGIGLIWTGNNHYSSDTFSSMSVFATLRTSSVNQSTSSIAIEFDKWIHIMLTWDPNTHILNLYKDGILINSKTFSAFTNGVSRVLSLNYNAVYGGNGPAASIPFYCNDVRIYDHCLSAAEVREIAQGLILHYKLDSEYLENTINYAPSPYGSYSAATPAWDASKHPNAVKVPNWTNGYNGGVSEPSIGYHAMWNIIDNIPTLIFQNHNSVVEKTNRWMGTSSSTISIDIAAGVQYTISYEQRTIDTLGSHTTCGLYYKYTSSGSNGFHDGCPTIGQNTILNTWQRFSHTFTRSANVDGTGTKGVIYIYGNFSPESTMQIRNIQLEIKNHMTGYTIDSRTNIQVQDSSGYGHNGTINGNITLNNSSRRYDSCIYSADGGSNYIQTPMLTMPTDAITLNIWFKSSNTAPTSDYHMIVDSVGNSSERQHYEMCIHKTGYLRGGLYVNGSRKADNCTTTTGCNGQWHMLTMTYDGANVKRYFDGNMEKSTAAAITTGLQPSATLRLLKDGYSTYACKEASLSDFRIYATALSADDIKQLYQVGAKVDNLQNLHTFEIKETNRNLLAGRLWSNGYSQHNPNAGLFTNFNSKGEYQFTANSTSAGSEYIPINPSGHTYEYDYTISINAGNQFYIGFERYDANKTARSNNACIYTYATKPSSDVIKQHFTGTVNLSTDGTNPCAFIALRILNGWSGTTSGVTGTATIHSFSLREIGTKQNPKLTKQGQFIEEELKEETNMKLHKNGIIETNNLIER